MTAKLELSVSCSFQARMAIPDHDGVCRNPHGYRFQLTATVSGETDPTRPWLMDIVALEELLDARIVGQLDGTNLNDRIGYPSLEGILLWCSNELQEKVPGLVRLDLAAPPRYQVTWRA